MDTRLFIIAGVSLLAFILVWLGKQSAKKRFIRNRIPLSFEEIRRSSQVDVSTESLARVLRTLGDLYRVNPQLLRPNDELKDFFDLDSWSLGTGTEKLNKWLADEGFTDVSPGPTTILDLVLLLERRALH
jgi:hypothetical protein